VRNVFFHDKKINKKLAFKLTIKDKDSKTIIHLWLFNVLQHAFNFGLLIWWQPRVLLYFCIE